MRNDQIEVIPETSPTVADFTGCLQEGTFDFWITSATGIAIRDEIPEDSWRILAENVAAMFEATGKAHAKSAMILGDVLKFGERFPNYESVIDETRKFMQVSMKTILNWSWIAGRIPPSRRHQDLTLAHHEAVAKLEADEQDEFLTLAESEGFSVKELKGKIRERHPGKPRSPKAETIVKIEETWPAMLDAGTRLLNFLKAHEEEITDEHKPLLWDYWKLYRRRFL